jgi:hypothetical protein
MTAMVSRYPVLPQYNIQSTHTRSLTAIAASGIGIVALENAVGWQCCESEYSLLRIRTGFLALLSRIGILQIP